MFRLLFVLVLALWPAVVNAQGFAPQTQTRCAIASTSPAAHVVLSVGTVENRDAIDLAAAFCTGLIASGEWNGIANDVRPMNYADVAAIQLSPAVIIGILAEPDYASTTAAYAFAEYFGLSGYPVDYR